MSYCRFGPGSDLYIYDDEGGGVTLHVASRRHILPDDMPQNPMLNALGLSIGDMTPEDFAKKYKAYSDALSQCPLEKIGLSRDGESYRLDASEAADLVASLQAEGYHVPDHVIEALRDEACGSKS